MIEDGFYKTHKAEGYSDHLPIYAKFSTNKNDTNILKDLEQDSKNNQLSTILDLYNKEKLTEAIFLNNAIVIYKNNEKVIIKKPNDRAIFIYNNAQDLKLGHSYNLQINQIFDFRGLKEIKEFTTLDQLEEITNYKSLYLDANSVDIFDFKYENEVITNLTGVVKNSKLYLNDDKYIEIYCHTRNILPKNGTTITITSGHLASYMGKMQINLYRSTDFKIGY
jgi:hypothetical protein